MTDRVRAEMRRSGGFTGRTVHVRLDSDHLPPSDAARLVQVIGQLDLSRLPAPDRPGPGAGPVAGPGADLMRYELVIERDGQRWQGTMADPTVPGELRPLLRMLTAAAR